MSTVGFEPTPPKRLRPERSALDHSAKLTSTYNGSSFYILTQYFEKFHLWGSLCIFKKIIKGLLIDWCKLKKRKRGEGGIEPLAFYGPTDLKSALRPIEDHHRFLSTMVFIRRLIQI